MKSTPTGSVEVIVGSMFSGKSEELIRLLRRAEFARQPLQVFKPRIDKRYSEDHVASHDRSLFPSTVIDHAAEIYRHLSPDTRVIGIDEGQFFDDELVDVADELANRGLRVIIAGLDMDWKGEPFHPIPSLMAIADSVLKLHAVCVICGNQAARTQRLVKNTSSILVGERDAYEARCRECFDPDLSIDAKVGRAKTAFELHPNATSTTVFETCRASATADVTVLA
jgi:thymidine kinase